MRLELGAGAKPTQGFVHHDRWVHAPHITVAFALDAGQFVLVAGGRAMKKSLAEKLSAKERTQVLEWATRAMHGLDESHVFVGILDDHPLDVGRMEFLMQLGFAVLNGKSIVIPVPHGVEVPAKLAAIADRIVRYNPDDMASLQHGLTKALTELGVNPQ